MSESGQRSGFVQCVPGSTEVPNGAILALLGLIPDQGSRLPISTCSLFSSLLSLPRLIGLVNAAVLPPNITPPPPQQLHMTTVPTSDL